MIIAIDGYEANQSMRVGIGEYAYQILINLYKLVSLNIDKNLKFRVYLPCEPVDDMPKANANWEYKVRKPQKLWTFCALPISLYLDKPKADVIFSPTHYVPRFINMKRVMSIMDLSYLSYPELFRKKDLYQLKEWTKYSVKKASYILTISQFSRNAILREYNYPEDHISVTYPGIPYNKQYYMNLNGIARKKFNLINPYILSVGTLQPRKNFEKLIESFSKLIKHAKFENYDLVIVGKKGWLYENIVEAPSRLGIEKRVRFLDFVEDKDLPDLYAEAECFVLPSLYEGFGLPALEAMANGCIVVVSDVSSLPEIVGDCGILVDPKSVSSIENGILQALKEKGNKTGNSRIELGKKRAAQFTWENAAKKTLEILEKVGSKSK